MRKKEYKDSQPTQAQMELWREYRENPDSGDALSQLVDMMLPFVHRVLERMSINLPSHVEIEDLLQSATVGLYHAINRFDPKQGISFEGFAYPRIRGAVLDELRSLDHVSRSCRAQLKKIEQTICEWIQKHREHSREDELAKEMGMTVSELSGLLDRAQPWLSLDDVKLQADGGGVSLKDVLADTQAVLPDQEAQREDMRRYLRQAFKQLGSREQKILYLYYFEELRLSEIAILYELTEARICQIHALAIAKLKATLGSGDKMG